jgi:hypothetical protein
MDKTKHIICFSGGHSSAIVAIHCVAKYGKGNVILVNHDIKTSVEADDIKRFKKQVAEYLGLPITYVNVDGITNPDELPDQFDVSMKAGAITYKNGHAICTNKLKTAPFLEYLEKNFFIRDNLFEKATPCIIYYGFDKNESERITRRASILGAIGYKTAYPIAFEEMEISDTRQIGIEPPNSYSIFKHANCIGCLKAGLLHWYVTYCIRYDLYCKGKILEAHTDYSIHRITRNRETTSIYLDELEPIFRQMQIEGVPATEHQSAKKFGHLLRKYQIEECNVNKPCECIS